MAASSAFKKETWVAKLADLTEAQESIENACKWCMEHVQNAQQIVDAWKFQFESAKPNKTLPLIYLANHILCKSHSSTPFPALFWPILPPLLQRFASFASESQMHKLNRVIDVWDNRNLFRNLYASAGTLRSILVPSEKEQDQDQDERQVSQEENYQKSAEITITESPDGSVDVDFPYDSPFPKLAKLLQQSRLFSVKQEVHINSCSTDVNLILSFLGISSDISAVNSELRLVEKKIGLEEGLRACETLKEMRSELVHHLRDMDAVEKGNEETLKTHMDVIREGIKKIKKLKEAYVARDLISKQDVSETDAAQLANLLCSLPQSLTVPLLSSTFQEYHNSCMAGSNAESLKNGGCSSLLAVEFKSEAQFVQDPALNIAPQQNATHPFNVMQPFPHARIPHLHQLTPNPVDPAGDAYLQHQVSQTDQHWKPQLDQQQLISPAYTSQFIMDYPIDSAVSMAPHQGPTETHQTWINDLDSAAASMPQYNMDYTSNAASFQSQSLLYSGGSTGIPQTWRNTLDVSASLPPLNIDYAYSSQSEQPPPPPEGPTDGAHPTWGYGSFQLPRPPAPEASMVVNPRWYPSLPPLF